MSQTLAVISGVVLLRETLAVGCYPYLGKPVALARCFTYCAERACIKCFDCITGTISSLCQLRHCRGRICYTIGNGWLFALA